MQILPAKVRKVYQVCMRPLVWRWSPKASICLNDNQYLPGTARVPVPSALFGTYKNY